MRFVIGAVARNLREHTTTRTRTRARVTDDIESLLLRDLTYSPGTIGLERIDGSHILALLVAEGGAIDLTHPGLDGTTIDDDGGAVMADGGDETAGHVLVTPGSRLRSEELEIMDMWWHIPWD